MVRIDDKVREAIRSTKAELREKLDSLGDEHLQMALIAELAEEMLYDRQSSDSQKKIAGLGSGSKKRKRKS